MAVQTINSSIEKQNKKQTKGKSETKTMLMGLCFLQFWGYASNSLVKLLRLIRHKNICYFTIYSKPIIQSPS